jgi:hypothetical protein
MAAGRSQAEDRGWNHAQGRSGRGIAGAVREWLSVQPTSLIISAEDLKNGKEED